jgi:hypothetical protein
LHSLSLNGEERAKLKSGELIKIRQMRGTLANLAASLIPMVLLTVTPMEAQQSFDPSDSVFGTDPLLINGTYYDFIPPRGTDGDQYLTGPVFMNGSLTLRGETYEALPLNYDIYNQRLLLSYRNQAGGESIIVISDAWLEKFSFRGMSFEIAALPDKGKSIVQVIGHGPVRLGYLWKKALDPDSFHGARSYSFSSPRKEMYILLENKSVRYSNNKMFLATLDETMKKRVREYIAMRRIRVKRADDDTMTELMDFYNAIRRQ